jgi:tetratricopeptide (TPR) repeat protein
VAFSLYTLAMIEIGLKKYDEAEPHLARAIAIREAIFGHYSGQLAIWLNDLAFLLCLEGKYAEAEPVYRRILALPTGQLPADSPIRVECLRDLAEIYVQKKEDLRAEIFDRKALEMLEQGDALSPELAETLEHLVQILRRTHRDDQAQTLEDRIRTIRDRR